jgi:hypothetical protein
MKKQHTQGPWYVLNDYYRYPGIESVTLSIVIFGDDGESCGVQGDTHEEAIANANLIAAAPDLLEALEAQESAEKYIEEEQGSAFFEETYPKMLDYAAGLRRAAIAKAKGVAQ